MHIRDKEPGKLEIRCQENWNICPQLRALPEVGHGATEVSTQIMEKGAPGSTPSAVTTAGIRNKSVVAGSAFPQAAEVYVA